jgi:hypothetical protein
MDEMLDDMMLNMEDDDELEEEADAEVDKVLFDITDGKLGAAGTAENNLPVSDLTVANLSSIIIYLFHRARKRWTRKKRRIWSSTRSSLTTS